MNDLHLHDNEQIAFQSIGKSRELVFDDREDLCGANYRQSKGCQTFVKWDIAMASCPAPLIRTGTSSWISPVILLSADWAADFSCKLNSGSEITAFASC